MTRRTAATSAEQDPLLAQLGLEGGASTDTFFADSPRVPTSKSRQPRQRTSSPRNFPLPESSSQGGPTTASSQRKGTDGHALAGSSATMAAPSSTNNRETEAGASLFHGTLPDEEQPLLTKRATATQRRRRVYCGFLTCRCLVILLAVILVLCAIFIPLTRYVFLPQYVERQMDSAKIDVQGVNMKDLTEDGFALSMAYTLKDLPESYTVHISSMNVDVLYNSTKLGEMILPEFRVEQGQKSLNMSVNNKFRITDDTWWIAFIGDMLNKPTFTWKLQGLMVVRIEGTPLGTITLGNIKFHKDAKLPAMDGLKSITIKDMRLPRHLNWQPDGSIDPKSTIQGIEVEADVEIYNPSLIQASLGDIMLGIRFDPSDNEPNPLDRSRGATLGVLVCPNMTLLPGMNSMSLRGALVNPDSWPDLNPDIPSDAVREIMGTFVSRFLHEQTQLLGIVGVGARNEFRRRKAWADDGPNLSLPESRRGDTFLLEDNSRAGAENQIQDSSNYGDRLPYIDRTVKWLDTGIRALQTVIPHTLDPSRGTMKIEGVSVDRMNVKIRHHTEVLYRPIISASIRANLTVPFGFQLDVRNIRQSMDLYRCPSVDKHLAAPSAACAARDDLIVGHFDSNWDDAETANRTLLPLETSRGALSPIRFYTIHAALNNSTRRMNDRFLRITTPEQEHNYQVFLRDVVVSESIHAVIRGSCSARMYSGLGGYIEITDIPFEDVITLRGLNGFRTPEQDLLEVTRNLDVRSVGAEGNLAFQLNGAYMKKLGGDQLGLELLSPLILDMYYKPEEVQKISDGYREGEGQHGVEASIGQDSTHQQARHRNGLDLAVNEDHELGLKLGTVDIPSLNLGDQGDCTRQLRNPFTGVVTNTTGTFCSVAARGTFRYPTSDMDQELCSNRTTCAGRSFLTQYLHGGPSVPVKIHLRAVDGPRDLGLALQEIVLRNVSLPGYTPTVFDTRRAPFPIVRKIIVKPGRNLWDGKLWMWLEVYNPLQVPLRFFYFHVNTFVGKTVIGKLHVNLTNYDPFEKKPGYVFPGYPQRSGFNHKTDPYGPHPSSKCVASGDCQIAPFDIAPSGLGGPRCLHGYKPETTLTRRMEVGFTLSSPGVLAFWKTLFNRNDDVRMNVSISGQVAIAIGAPLFRGQPRNNTSAEPVPGHDPSDPATRDPFLFPYDPTQDRVQLTWLDYSQDQAEMWFRKMSNNDTIPLDPPYLPPECNQTIASGAPSINIGDIEPNGSVGK